MAPLYPSEDYHVAANYVIFRIDNSVTSVSNTGNEATTPARGPVLSEPEAKRHELRETVRAIHGPKHARWR